MCYWWKNLQFSSNQADITPKLFIESAILLKYQLDWEKIVDLLLIAYFWVSPIFYCSYFMFLLKDSVTSDILQSRHEEDLNIIVFILYEFIYFLSHKKSYKQHLAHFIEN